MAIDLENAPYEVNLTDKIDEGRLGAIGFELLEQIEIDEDSRKEWMDTNRSWLKLAAQVREDKTFPWPGASNVKYPLLTIASMQFHARALPNLVNSNQPVRVRVIGRDFDYQKQARADRNSKYMSFQILEGMDDWMDEMDRLLFVLPMLGIVYKKTFWSDAEEKIKSIMILPNDMIINYHAQSYERARMTQVIHMDENEIVEFQRNGIFRDITLPPPDYDVDMNRNAEDDIQNLKGSEGSDMDPYKIYESHCWLDLDEDGYKEPYIVTLTKDGEILRIMARWSERGLFYNEAGDLIKIVPDKYFTPFMFMPDPASAVSGLGLGALLGPINESVNTIVNQLIDAGTLANQQSGFLSRGMKLRGGATRFRPGEWKIVNTTGDDLRKSVFPLPVRDPSATLFQLLGMLINSGERVSSISDIMVGENPGQNQPATTTMAVLEQGLQVFSSIYKRIHRALSKEYKIIYRLNSIYLNVPEYNLILDEGQMMQGAQLNQDDWDLEGIDVKPASDPSIVSQTQKAVKAQGLFELAAAGAPINIGVATQRMLEAQGQEDIPAIMNVQPQPNPEFELEKAKFDHQRQLDIVGSDLEALKIRAQAIKDESGAQLNVAKSAELGFDAELRARQQEIDTVVEDLKLVNERMKIENDKEKNNKQNETSQ